MLRVCYLGLAVSTMLASPGTEEPANAEPTDPVADVLKPLKIVDADELAESEVPAPLALAPASDTNAPVIPPVPLRDKEPIAPPNVRLSPAMADVVKLVQAGVSPDVLMAYVTNSSAVFNVDSDVIVYLNDLGVTNTVITALIQHDSSPETVARKASAAAVQPLPPGVSTTAPVANVYPPAPQRTLPAPGQTSYPGDFSTVTDTNAYADAGTAVTAPLTPPAENVTVNYFYSSLSPYGSWVDVPGYGLCWQPTVAAADPYWRPYADRGRWLWSDAGWYWYSDYTWGWAPFHYGRWCSYPRYGWIWVPGSVWAPSWVTWRYTDAYCGWAPLPPGCGFRSGIGLTWYGHGVSIGFDFGLASHCWSYVPSAHFCDWNVRRHFLPANRLHAVHLAATPAHRFTTTHHNSMVMNHGIEPNTIARATRTKIPTAKITDHALPTDARVKPERLNTSGNNLAVVRPQLPKIQPGAAVVASRGTATKGQPINLSSGAAQANATTVPSGRQTLAPPRANNNAGSSAIVRDQANARNAANVIPNAGARQEPANRPNVNPSRPQATAPNVQRDTAIARNNVTPGGNPAPVGRTLAPPQTQSGTAQRVTPQQTAPPARLTPQQSSPAPQQSAPAPRVAPQTAPPTRGVSPMIRSFADTPRTAPSALAPPSVRSQAPSYSPQPSARPQFTAPSRAEVSRPSVAPPVQHSAPSVSRSAPSSGGGGGGGGRSSGGKNRGE